MQGTQIDNLPIGNLYTTRNFLMPTLNEERKSIVLVKNECEYRKKIEIKMVSLDFSDYQDSDAREKSNEFSIEVLREKIELVVAEN